MNKTIFDNRETGFRLIVGIGSANLEKEEE
jgi:hypothetical protein